jgi:Fe-S cluster assembly ATP-binding protein
MLRIKNLVVSVEKKEILHGVDFSVRPGEIHAIMGPNGSGKTSFAMGLMGHPNYSLRKKGSVLEIDGTTILALPPEERAKKGLFVSFQSPVEISGVSLLAFLRTAAKAVRPDEKKPLSLFKDELKASLLKVDLSEGFLKRSVNEGFSGGERKRVEVVQLLTLLPKYAVLDEIDSGLDVDSLKVVAKAIKGAVKEKGMGIIIITHYQRLLHFLKPDYVHVLVDGKVKQSGGMELVRRIEKEGYAAI